MSESSSTEDPRPICAGPHEGAAAASRPDEPLHHSQFNRYEANPVPWWVAAYWLAFFVFGVAYLIVSLLPD